MGPMFVKTMPKKSKVVKSLLVADAGAGTNDTKEEDMQDESKPAASSTLSET